MVGGSYAIAGAILLAAPDATILAYRVLDSDGQGTVFGVAEAIIHAVDNGADVINVSFGAGEKFDSTVLKDALDYAKDHDVLIVAAAGNASTDDKRYPAAEKDIISVAAFDSSRGELASFASHGKWVTVAAPGVDITSTVPGGGYATWSGSSMAAPFVAAQAALLISLEPDVDLKDLEKYIRDTTRKINGKKIEKGAIDFDKALDRIKK